MRRHNGPLVELTIARLKEFVREPEALFWVFAFPLLLAFALGLAFREKPPDRIPVGVVEGPGASWTMAALGRSPALQPRLYAPAAGEAALRAGKVSLLLDTSDTSAIPTAPGGPSSPLYRFDPTRPDARAARLEVDDALQRAAGRVDTVTARDEHVKEVGSRYIDF